MKIERGQIWKLGEHRLGVLDFISDDVSVLFGEDKVRLIITDPPQGTYEFDQDLDESDQYEEFTIAWMKKAQKFLAEYNAYYIFNLDKLYSALMYGQVKAGYYYSQMIVWIKNSVIVGKKDYLPQHEIIAYGWSGKHKFERTKGKTVIANAEEMDKLVYEDKKSQSKLHPHMKPVGLLRKFILNSSRIGEVILDPFGGSGSTIMACEHTRRKCIMTEIEPKYCEVIIRRWEKLTGQKAELMQ